METRKINYKSDFDFILYLKDCKDKEKTVPFPECDFDVRFWTSVKANAYTASYKSGTYTNCLRAEDGGMHFVFDSHHLGAGTLKWEPHFEFPNGLYPDSTQDIFSKEPLGIELVDGPGECPTTAEVEVMLPYIKGDPFTWEDFTPEQIKELQRPAMEAADSVKDLEKSIETAENDRNIAERNRKDEERVRVNQESIRQTQEAFRENHERSREKAEEARQTSEEDREAAEGERVGAENARAEEFASWETEIDSKADRSELSNVIAQEPLTPENFPDINTYTREDLKKDLFIDMWTSACGSAGKYDPANAPDAEHPFYLNTLWLNYEEAMKILEYRAIDRVTIPRKLYRTNIRTNIFMLESFYYSAVDLSAFAQDSAIEVARLAPGDGECWANGTDSVFTNCRKLKTVLTTIVDYDRGGVLYRWRQAFKNCVLLETVKIKSLNNSISFADSPSLSLDSISFMVTNAANTSPITITLHPTAYARVTDELFATAASKNITIASA